MTRLLYYEDPNLLTFDASIASVRRREDQTEVVLDATAFYPEGGGQPADAGEINGVPVVHVRKEGDEVVHVVRSDADASRLATGVARGRVDEARRRDYRQQHTGQHILSAALMETGHYETVSVHQGADYTTIEVDAPDVPPADIEAVERLANQAIENDLPVTTTWVTEREVGDYPLRRPPKVSGSIRIVQVGDMDCVACGGVHVNRTAEIRLVHAIAVESIRGNTRIAWKIGNRALAHYAQCSSIVSELSSTLSAQPSEIHARVTAQESQTKEFELESRRLSRRIHGLVARSLLAEGEATPEAEGASTPEAADADRTITAAFEDEPRDFLRGVAEELVRSAGVAVCLTNHAEGRLQWTVGIGPGCSVSFDDLRDDLLPVIGAKGGGRPPIWQGVGTRPEAAQEFLTTFRRLAAGARRA